MLRKVKQAQMPEIGPEEIFIERYDRILGWALQLANYERDLAEDLLHDLYIQFVLNSPAVETIENIDGYLYVTLRNLHIAQQRRANRNRLIQLSIVEYDSAVIGLSTIDFRDQLAAQDELRRICHYACSRKETAKIASVLILRFVHGYYPDEIIQVAGSPRSAVDKWLKLARGEAKASLEKDPKISFITTAEIPEFDSAREVAHTPGDLLDELRETIFRSRQGKCIADLNTLYPAIGPVDCASLAHIVACAVCLDGVNRLLGMSLLRERTATETLSRDKNKSDKDGGSGGGSSSGGGGMRETGLALLRRKAKDTFVHKPQELCVAVNGYELGSHRVAAERSELNLIVERDDRIDFIEVYTEQKIRLLMHNIEEVPPSGPGERNTVVRLSDDRMLEFSLRFTSPSPTIQVTYLDPTFNLDTAAEGAFTAESQRSREGVISMVNGRARRLAAIHTRPLGLDDEDVVPPRGLVGRFVETLTSLGFWLRPSTIAVAVSCLLIASILYFNITPTVPTLTTSVEVINKASEAETALAARTDLVVHRTINLEERNGTNGEVRSRKRIDIWQSGERKAESKRLYDEGGRLLAGEFETGEGTTIYEKRSEVSRKDSKTQSGAQGAIEKVWRTVPSAIDFNRLVAAANTKLTDSGDRYIVNYETSDQTKVGIVKASLTLNKSDLRPVEQVLTIRKGLPNTGDDLTEYHFIESVFEQRSPDTVPPSVFEPDAELLVPEVAVVKQTKAEPEDAKAEANTNSNTTAPTAIATADLEVEVLRLLNTAGADMDDQTDVKRDSAGRLLVTGLVDSPAKKAEILRALAPVKDNAAVIIRIETFEEAAKRQKQSTNPTEVTRIEVAKGQIAVFDEVARRIGSTDEGAVRRFSAQVLNRSRAVMATAGALKKLAGRFSKDDLKSMTPDARAKWLAVIRGHARNVEAEARRLRQDIQTLFYPGTGAGAGDAGISIDTDEELLAGANRLFAESAANDRVIRSAFTISADSSSGASVKNPAFARQLAGVERLAVSLQRAN